MLSNPTLQQLKSADPDRCRAAVFADKSGRERLRLLYAFHYELAKVPEMVSEPMIGQIRYQWWREAVAEIYDGKPVRQHEITTPFAKLVTNCDIPRFRLERLIDGRERDLDPQPFKDIAEAKEYCRQTSGVLMQIAVQLLGTDLDDAILSAGEAWGLTGLARAYRYYRDGMLRALNYEDICEAAERGYQDAAMGLNTIPSEAFPAIAYAALIPPYLKRLTKADHDPANISVNYGPLAKRLCLLGAAFRGRI